MTLYPWQEASCSEIVSAIKTYGVCADLSQTGTGKTFKACAAAKELGLFPLVIAPKVMIPEWVRVGQLFQLDIYALNYEKVKGRNFDLGGWKIRNRVWTWDIKEKVLLIFDEAHRLGGATSQNAKLLIAAKRQNIPTLLLSATLADSPLRMKAIGFALGLHKLEDWLYWLQANHVRKDFFGKMEYRGGEKGMEAIRNAFRDRSTCLTFKALKKNFPENHVTTFSVPTKEDIDSEYINDLKRLKEEASTGMVEMLRSRQLVELYKMSPASELVEDLIEQGNSVVFFVNFKATLDFLYGCFTECCAIYGGQSEEARQEQIDLFQSNKIKVMVCMIQAGGQGISLHDLYGRPRVSLINPGWSAVDLIQTLGRIHRAGSKSPALQRILFAQDSKIENKIRKAIESKLNNISALNDSDLSIGDVCTL